MSDDNRTAPPDTVAMMDQMATMAENLAMVVGGYHKKLITQGTPAELAEKMTLDLNIILWDKLMGNEGNHGGSFDE